MKFVFTLFLGNDRAMLEKARETGVIPIEIFDDIQLSVWVNLSTELFIRFVGSRFLARYLQDLNDPEGNIRRQQKLEDFFGMKLVGSLNRVELISVVETRGFETIAAKRQHTQRGGGKSRRFWKGKELDPRAIDTHSSSSTPKRNQRTRSEIKMMKNVSKPFAPSPLASPKGKEEENHDSSPPLPLDGDIAEMQQQLEVNKKGRLRRRTTLPPSSSLFDTTTSELSDSEKGKSDSQQHNDLPTLRSDCSDYGLDTLCDLNPPQPL